MTTKLRDIALAALVASFIRSESLLRWWTLAFTTGAALYSFPLYSRFNLLDPGFQFRQTVDWIPMLKIQYALGVDGISLLLVLLTILVPILGSFAAPLAGLAGKQGDYRRASSLASSSAWTCRRMVARMCATPLRWGR